MFEVNLYLSGSHVAWFRMPVCPRAGETVTLTGEPAKEVFRLHGANSFRVEGVEHEISLPVNEAQETIHVVNARVSRL